MHSDSHARIRDRELAERFKLRRRLVNRKAQSEMNSSGHVTCTTLAENPNLRLLVRFLSEESIVMKMDSMKVVESPSTSGSTRSDGEGLMMGGRYLSKEVVCKILGKLPVRSFLQLRCVCKRWNTILDDVEFQSISSLYETQNALTSSGSFAPFLLWDADSSRPLLSFDLQLWKWRTFHLLHSLHASVICSTRGLLLTVQNSSEGKTLFVVNPLTKVERQIPNLSWAEYEIRQMAVDDAGAGNYFITAEQIPKKGSSSSEPIPMRRLEIQIYDSRRRVWVPTGGFPDNFRYKNAFAMNGHLLFLAQNLASLGMKGVGLFKFDGRGAIEPFGLDVPVHIGPTFRQWIPRLFGREGSLMLIGETETLGRGVFVWQLNSSTFEWERKHEMPNDLFEGSVGSYEFVVCDDYVCVHPSRYEKNRAIVGNLATNSWHILPTVSPSLYVGRSAFIFDSFCFYEPRVGAKV
ncbi:hypothetical protein R1sor_013059 [Riccia sorocarpa]|uniref:F-box domain-containing protein n=1 Tax=Riccia sorocarpa TaxID=122646 RepID=A0ABD3H908_9MARC